MSPTTKSSWPAAKHHQISGRAGRKWPTATRIAATEERPIKS